jgi:hypothetical protein
MHLSEEVKQLVTAAIPLLWDLPKHFDKSNFVFSLEVYLVFKGVFQWVLDVEGFTTVHLQCDYPKLLLNLILYVFIIIRSSRYFNVEIYRPKMNKPYTKTSIDTCIFPKSLNALIISVNEGCICFRFHSNFT